MTSLPTGAVEPEDEEDDVKKVINDDGDSDTEVEQESENDEEALLLMEDARLKAEEAALKGQRLAKIRRSIERRTASIAVLRADVDDGYARTGAAAVAAVDQTPARLSLRPRVLAFQSTVGRKAPSAAAVARQAAIDELPDIPVSGPVSGVIAPTPVVVGSGRISAPTVTNAVAVAAASQVLPPSSGTSTATPLVSRSTVNKPKEFSGDDPVQNERVARWVAAMNRYLHLSKVPPLQHLDTARSYFSSAGGAEEWIASREEEVA